jgi:hypothetical protein
MSSLTTSKEQLPPDPEDMNDDRSEWASAAVEAFISATRTDNPDAVSDLLCDLMHFCDRNAGPGDEEFEGFEEALDRARQNYEEETMEDVFGCTCGEEIPLSDKDEIDEHIATCNGGAQGGK